MVHWQVIFANRRTCYGLSGVRSARKKIWRLPTLAQAIQALPSATLRLTAEFGMGSGRTTALSPPKSILVVHCQWPSLAPAATYLKRAAVQTPRLARHPITGREQIVFFENYT